MELVTDFEILTEKILEQYKDLDVSITVGVLLADYRQSDAREYILNYLNRFDELSGKYIDFYLPGYYLYTGDSDDEWEKRSHYNMTVSRHKSNDCISIRRTGEKYYFDEYLFEDFLRDMEKRMDILYTYNPMLLLVEVNMNKARGKLEYQRKMIIELDNTQQGIRRSGCLFDQIFQIAQRMVNLDRFGKAIRMRYIKGCAIKSLAKALDGNIIEVVQETREQILMCKIK